MRIISGKARSITLQVPPGNNVRPTDDRVKETLFATLGNLNNVTFIDLFSGTGALGLEALSRGAARVVMVERSLEHIAYIEKNLAAVWKSMGSHGGIVQILRADVVAVPELLANLAGIPKILVADPPYHPAEGAFGGAELLRSNRHADWCGNDSQLVLEHQSASLLPWAPIGLWRPYKQKKFGIRTLTFARLFKPLTDHNDPIADGTCP